MGLFGALLPKKMSSWWMMRGWGNTTPYSIVPTAKKIFGEEKGAKFAFWMGLFMLIAGLWFIICGLLGLKPF